MATETENTLHKVDSLTEEHKDGAAKKGHRRVSSADEVLVLGR
jgi:hypothetical protein